MIHTKNPEVLKAINGMIIGAHNYLSNNSVFIMQQLFSDAAWLDSFVKTTRRRLTMQYVALKRALDSAEIPVAECHGSLMLFADFSEFLGEDTWEAEEELDEELFREVKLHAQSGRCFLASSPGWFRLMFTAQTFHSEEEIAEPFEELGRRLRKWREGRQSGLEKR